MTVPAAVAVPAVGHEEELDTFSYTGNPTRTRLWVGSDGDFVEVPAGRFEDCLLVRATVTESPLGEGAQSLQRATNRLRCGER
jgi:hypothetical protein